MNKKSLALGLVLLAGTSVASAEELGVSVNAGIVGLGIGAGIDVTYAINPSVNIRGGFLQGSQTVDVTIDSNDFSITSKASTMGIYADWMIGQGDLRLTAGYVANNGSLDLAATGTIDYGIGAPIASTLAADITFKASPYVGIGWGNAAKVDDTFGFNMDIGLLLDAKPTVDITQATNASAAQIANLESELAGEKSIKALPVATIGFTYHF